MYVEDVCERMRGVAWRAGELKRTFGPISPASPFLCHVRCSRCVMTAEEGTNERTRRKGKERKGKCQSPIGVTRRKGAPGTGDDDERRQRRATKRVIKEEEEEEKEEGGGDGTGRQGDKHARIRHPQRRHVTRHQPESK